MKSPLRLRVAFLVLLVPNPHLHAQVNFAPAATYAVGSGPASVTAADVNGDGKPDLICANVNSNTLSVLTNDGNGGFALAATYVAGIAPISVTTADVNRDGKMDLICANNQDNTLSVLTNNGSGGFVLASSPGVGNGPWSVTAADVNGDDKVDLISANERGNTLSVLTNNGSGGFALSSSPGVGNVPVFVTTADVNGDEKLELICANLGLIVPGSLSVLTNSGSGGFALASSPLLVDRHNGPSSVTAVDVNGDGKVDLISANWLTNTLTVLTNGGNGGFALASSLVVGSGPWSVTSADVNGDGKVDLICGNYGTNTLTVLTNNGSGGFVLASSPIVGNGPHSVTTTDVNGDGKVDLISANYNDGTLTVLINVPTLTINPTGNSVIVSWSSSWTNWTLQQNSDLTTTNWSASGGLSDNGTNKSLAIASPMDSRFFRLLHP